MQGVLEERKYMSTVGGRRVPGVQAAVYVKHSRYKMECKESRREGIVGKL
jgi:hypothetical protein